MILITENNQNIIKNNNFKKWFGKSKIVDKKGLPLIVYSGSRTEFNVYDKSKINRIMFGIGFYFTANRSYAAKYGSVRDFYLRIEKPFYTHNFIEWFNKYISKEKVTFVLGYWSKYKNEIQKEMEKQGYDGVISGDFNDPNNVIVAFDSNQIKSINAKEFNLNSNNIYESFKISRDVWNKYTKEEQDIIIYLMDNFKYSDLQSVKSFLTAIKKLTNNNLNKVKVLNLGSIKYNNKTYSYSFDSKGWIELKV